MPRMQQGIEGGFTAPPEETGFEIVTEIDADRAEAAIGDAVNAHDTEPRRVPRGGACVAHTFADDPRVSRAGLGCAYRRGQDRRVPLRPGGALDVDRRSSDRFPPRRPHIQLTGRVLHAQCPERLSYVLQSGPDDLPTYLTWLIRPTPGGCTIRLEIDEVDNADSREDAEDVWLPVLAALQHLVNPGQGRTPRPRQQQARAPLLLRSAPPRSPAARPGTGTGTGRRWRRRRCPVPRARSRPRPCRGRRTVGSAALLIGSASAATPCGASSSPIATAPRAGPAGSTAGSGSASRTAPPSAAGSPRPRRRTGRRLPPNRSGRRPGQRTDGGEGAAYSRSSPHGWPGSRRPDHSARRGGNASPPGQVKDRHDRPQDDDAGEDQDLPAELLAPTGRRACGPVSCGCLAASHAVSCICSKHPVSRITEKL